MRIYPAFVVSSSLFTTISPAVADEAVTRLDQVVVTPSRGVESQQDSLAAVSVITRQDIERLQAQSVQELLAGLPGAWIVNNGGPGKSTNLQLRGTNGDHVVVLLDGIKIGSATLGSTAFEQIPVDQIERIEIVRGPRSSLYGSEAIGGVIQIFSRRGATGESLTPSFAIGGGNYGSRSIEAGVHGGVGASGWYRAGLNAQDTDNIDIKPTGTEHDRDGYRNVAGSLGAGWTFANGADVSASFLRSEGRNEYDGATTNEAENIQQVLGGRARFSPLKPWSVTLSAGQSRDFAENYHDPLVAVAGSPGSFTDNRGEIKTFRNSYTWQNDLQLAAEQTVSVGVDFIHDRVGGSNDYAETTRDNTGVFGVYRGGFGKHELQASVRNDDNEQFGSHVTGGGAYGYRFADALRFTASYGTAFKAPSFNDLYYPGYGIPTLEPEKARSSEVGLDGSGRAYGGVLSYAIKAFHSSIEQLIAYNPATFGPENLGKARIDGVELQLGGVFEKLSLQGTFNWLDPQSDNNNANKGNVLPRRARQAGRLDVDYQLLSQLSLGLSALGAGSRYDDLANTKPLAGYATLALRATWQATPSWALQLKGSNLLDKEYETARGFAQPDRTWFATLRYTPSTTARSE